MGTKWTFYEYVSENESAVSTHLKTASVKVDTEFWERKRHMENMTREEWSPKWAKTLTDEDGLFEMRFKADRVQQRPIACYAPSDGCITILFWAVEIGGKFNPKSALKTAARRKKEIDEGKVQPRLLTDESDASEEIEA